MPRPAYSEDQIQAIQNEIRAVALAVFRRTGMRGLTLRVIAREMGWTPAALYRYYANKEELLGALRSEGFVRMGLVLEQARSGAPDSREATREAMRAYLRFALAEPELFRLMFELNQGDQPCLPDVSAERSRAFSHARAIAADAIEAGWMKGDANLAAHLFWVGAHGLASLALAQQLDLGCSSEDLIEPLITQFVTTQGGIGR